MSYVVRELKPTFDRLTQPFAELMRRLGLTPNAITIVGLFFVSLGSLMLYYEKNLLAFLFLLTGALCDTLDGSLARQSGKSSEFGAFLDSLTDRVSDALPFVAIALSSEDEMLSFMAMTAVVFSYTVSYARARAEGLGYSLKVGIFERAERWIVLLTGVILDMLMIATMIVAIGSFVTTLQRVYTFRKLTGGE